MKQCGSDKTRPSRQDAFVTKKQLQCPVCEGTHGVWACQRFREKEVSERVTFVQGAPICSNCLRNGHTIEQCQSGSCRVCHRRHTLLHMSGETIEIKTQPVQE
ncbi:unnamed protein product [Heterotrigona itama]|uniref:Uncharacterized protein n=1 Tax=Heterotrigona itama TaxID=395501 RepID=A0A6V7HAB0_9HYME|nr:unnamed protein product [Heterotrigona itama]